MIKSKLTVLESNKVSPAFDANGQPTLGSGSAVYFAATPSGALGRFEVTDSYFYDNAGSGIVIESGASSPAIPTATSLIARNHIGYVSPSAVSANGPNNPGIRIGKGGAKIDILSNQIFTLNAPAVQLTPLAGAENRLGIESYSTSPPAVNLFESENAYDAGYSAFDLLADGIPLANEVGDGDSGPNNLLNKPEILQNQIVQNDLYWSIPFQINTHAGTHRFDLYELVATGAGLAWYYVKSVTREVNAGTHIVNDFVWSNSEAPSVPGAALNKVFTIVATGETTPTPGLNAKSSSEFSSYAVLRDPPNVLNVSIIGDSTAHYNDWLTAHQQYEAVPVANANQIRIQFSEHIPSLVSSNGSELKLRKAVDQYAALATNGFQYDSVNYAATWTFSETLNEKYAIELDSALIVDANGEQLDGNWDHHILKTNLTAQPDTLAHPARTFPSGSVDMENDDFIFHFAVRPPGNTTPHIATKVNGDYNDNEVVDTDDYALWKATFGNTSNLNADGNGDGIVNAGDFSPWRDNLGAFSAWSAETLGGSGGGPGVPVFDPLNVPRVSNVTISGSNSVHAPYFFDGHDGSGEQLRTVPVGGADTISITFTEDVNVTADRLTLTGLRTANRPTLADFNYNMLSMTATWRFTGWTFGDQYVISLSDSVTDIEGNRLDGEWTNPVSLTTVNSAVSEFPSGNGYAGGNFNFVATLLPGDANLDSIVNYTDYSIWSSHYGPNDLFSEGDFDGNSYVDSADITLFYAHYGDNLTSLAMLADLDGNWQVDDDDLDIFAANVGMSSPTPGDGDLDDDNDVDVDDLDLMFAQYGLELEVVS